MKLGELMKERGLRKEQRERKEKYVNIYKSLYLEIEVFGMVPSLPQHLGL